MTPLDYILAGTGTVSLGAIIWLVYEVVGAMKGERAALAVANINERAQRDAELERDHALEHVAQLLKERDQALAQLAATQTAAITAAKEHVDAVRTEVTEHPDLAGDVVTRMLASGPVVVGGVAPADSDGHPVATAVQPAAVAAAGGVRGDP